MPAVDFTGMLQSIQVKDNSSNKELIEEYFKSSMNFKKFIKYSGEANLVG